jgi:uncharacterized cofD-like protein
MKWLRKTKMKAESLKIVAFGGGNAMPKAVLTGLVKHDVDITTITSMVDNGGSTGQLRKDFDVLPPGDIRRHLLALSTAPKWKKDLFAFRFGHEEFGSGHVGHSFGNVFLAGLEKSLHDYKKVLDIAHDFLEVKGRCLPATIDKTQLMAELEDGTDAEGEDELDVPQKHDPKLKIKKIFLKPRAKAYPSAVEAVEKADAIVIGPGDLYTSSLPCFLPLGMKQAVKTSRSTKIFIAPPLTKLGETQGFLLQDFVYEVERYIGCKLDFVVYNTAKIEPERLREHTMKEPSQSVVVKADNDDDKFIGEDLLTDDEIAYDSSKLAKVIMRLAKSDKK